MSRDAERTAGGTGEAGDVPAAAPDTGGLLAVARYEGERRLPVTAAVTVALSLFGALFVWSAPYVTGGIDLEQFVAAMPPVLVELLGFEALGSLAGLLASEFYSLGWIVGLAGYVAYSAAGSVAGDVEDDRMDLLLAAPVSRDGVLLGKYLALLVPVLVANAVVPAVLYAGSLLVEDALDVTRLLALHATAVPYLLCWSAVGLLLGVVVRGGRTASRVAVGVVFAAWLLESLVSTTDYAWLGRATPTRYFDPPAVLLRGQYGLRGVAVLVLATLALLALAVHRFRAADLT